MPQRVSIVVTVVVRHDVALSDGFEVACRTIYICGIAGRWRWRVAGVRAQQQQSFCRAAGRFSRRHRPHHRRGSAGNGTTTPQPPINSNNVVYWISRGLHVLYLCMTWCRIFTTALGAVRSGDISLLRGNVRVRVQLIGHARNNM